MPGRLLLEIARALPGRTGAARVRAEESVLTIASGAARYRIHTYPAEDFPQLPDVAAAAFRDPSTAPRSSRRSRG